MLIGFRTIRPARSRLGLEDRHGAADRDGDDVRLTLLIPLQYAVVCRSRALGRPVRDRSVEQGHRQAAGAREPTARSRPSHRTPSSARSRRAPAVWQPVLRSGSDLRGGAPGCDPDVAQLGRHPEAPRAQRPRLDIHRSPPRYASELAAVRFEARPRLREPAPDEQFLVTGLSATIGAENIYSGGIRSSDLPWTGRITMRSRGSRTLRDADPAQRPTHPCDRGVGNGLPEDSHGHRPNPTRRTRWLRRRLPRVMISPYWVMRRTALDDEECGRVGAATIAPEREKMRG